MNRQQQGFSLLEVMVVMTIFLVVAGTVFELLNVSQQRYRSEQQVLESFQGARLGMDLMVRDIHNAGYPPPYTFPGNLPSPPTPPGYPGRNMDRAGERSGGYPKQLCGGSCRHRRRRGGSHLPGQQWHQPLRYPQPVGRCARA